MGFGFSFGKNKQTTTQNTVGQQTEAQTQSGTSTTNSTTTNNQSQNTNSTSASQGTSSTASNTAQTTTGQGTQQQQQTTNLFDQGTLSGLTNLVGQLLGGSEDGNNAILHRGMSQLGEFDLDAFVQSGLASAQAKSGTQVDELIGGILDSIGGRNNSMTSLLGNRVANDQAATLSGIRSNLMAQGQQILQSGINTAQSVVSNSQDFLGNLLNILKGGTQQTVGTTATQTSESQQGRQNATTNTSESNQTQQQQETSSVQTLAQVLAQLLNTNTQTNATESVVGTAKKSGGGISFG